MSMLFAETVLYEWHGAVVYRPGEGMFPFSLLSLYQNRPVEVRHFLLVTDIMKFCHWLYRKGENRSCVCDIISIALWKGIDNDLYW